MTSHPIKYLSRQFVQEIFFPRWMKKYASGVLIILLLVTVSNRAACQTTVFSTAGAHTYTVPSYAGPFEPGDVIERVELTVTIVGGGGGGGRGQGAGGGGGGQVRVLAIEVNSGDVFPITVGSGGAGGTAPNVNGSIGMASNFNGESAAGGLGGNGGNAGRGGSSGNGNSGGEAAVPRSGNTSNSRSAGGGGAGASTESGNGSTGQWSGNNANGGNGGPGIDGFGGGGGGASKGNGNGINGVSGTGIDGGSDGSRATAVNATNGGGGGGGWTRGGNGGDGLVIVSVSYSILPVALLEFNATFEEKNKLTRIRWSTATESESSHFEIERSFGKANDFLKVGKVMAMGWKDEISKYEFIDKNLPLFGGTIYYRIKQVDLNGSHVYSELMSINIPKTEAAKGVWRAYPNPISGEQLRVGLTDPSLYTDGQPISFRVVQATATSPFTTVSSIAEMNDRLPSLFGAGNKGLVILEIKWAKYVEYIKLFSR